MHSCFYLQYATIKVIWGDLRKVNMFGPGYQKVPGMYVCIYVYMHVYSPQSYILILPGLIREICSGSHLSGNCTCQAQVGRPYELRSTPSLLIF